MLKNNRNQHLNQKWVKSVQCRPLAAMNKTDADRSKSPNLAFETPKFIKGT